MLPEMQEYRKDPSIPFQFGYGSVSWLVVAEVIPPVIRPTGYPLIVASTWLFNFALAHSYTPLTAALQRHGVMWLYAVASAAGVVFVAACVPETAGRTDEEIAVFFRRDDAPEDGSEDGGSDDGKGVSDVQYANMGLEDDLEAAVA